MSQKTKALLAAGLATMSIAVVPLASVAAATGPSVQLACSGTSGGGCAG